MNEEPGKRGRPSLYTREIADEIINRLSHGESLTSICKTPGFPSRPAVCDWNDKNVDGFSDRYAKARRECSFARLDDANDNMLYLKDKTYRDELGNIRLDGPAIQLARLRIDFAKWEASKLIPDFADKRQVELSGKVGLVELFAESGDGSISEEDDGDQV